MALEPSPFPQTEARDGEENTASISCCSEPAQIIVSAQLSECLQRTRELALLGLADIPLQWNFLCCRTYSQRHAVCRFCFYSVSFPWTGLDWATVRNGAWRCCQHHQLQSRHLEWFTVWGKKNAYCGLWTGTAPTIIDYAGYMVRYISCTLAEELTLIKTKIGRNDGCV